MTGLRHFENNSRENPARRVAAIPVIQVFLQCKRCARRVNSSDRASKEDIDTVDGFSDCAGAVASFSCGASIAAKYSAITSGAGSIHTLSPGRVRRGPGEGPTYI